MSTLSIPANDVHITRSDLASVGSVYKRESKRLARLDAIVTFSAIAFLLGAIGVGQLLNILDDWYPLFLGIMYAVVLTSWTVEWVYQRRLVERLQILCLTCGEPILGSGHRNAITRRAEIMIATGNCVGCGHSFISDQQTKGA